MTTASKQILEKAAALIEKHGWTQGKYSDKNGCLCIFGAMNTAAHLLPPEDFEEQDAFGDAWLAVCRKTHPGKFFGGDATEWNDTPGRTKEEVLDLLRSVAAELGE